MWESQLITIVLNWFFFNILAKSKLIANFIYFYFELIGKVASALERDQDYLVFKDSESDDTWKTDPKFQELIARNLLRV